jgi:fatty-acyl-CoA synthase
MWFDEFLNCVKEQPHSVAIRFQRDEYIYDCMTYENLYQDILLKYSHLKQMGVGSGDTLAYLSKNSIEHVTLLIASNMLGASLVSLNFRLSEGEMLEIIELVDPKLLFLSNDFLDCSWDKKRKYPISKLQEPCFIQEYQPLIENPYQVCLVLFTSGSTGNPKGVLMHSKMLETNIKGTIQNWDLTKSDKTIVETPFFHTGGYNVLCLPLLSIGGECLVKEKFEAEESLLQIKQFEMTVYFGVPTMFQMMHEKYIELNANGKDLSDNFKSIRFFVSGGAPINQSLIGNYQELGIQFKQGFGMTEVGPNCFLLKEEDAIRKQGSIGKPMSHSIVRVRNEKGTLCDVFEVGELELGGEHLCLGYFQNEELYKQCRNDGLLKTGDLVKFDDEGYFYVVGRKKNMFISGGENVFPAEVEKAIDRITDIDEAIVVPVPDEKWGEVGLCFYTSQMTIEDFETNQKFRKLLEPSLSKYKIPHHWIQINNMPLLATGKIDRNRLKLVAESALKDFSQKSSQEVKAQHIRHFMV